MESVKAQTVNQIVQQRIDWALLYLGAAKRCNLNSTRLRCLRDAASHIETAAALQAAAKSILGTTENYDGGFLSDHWPEPEPSALEMREDYTWPVK